MKEGCGRQNGMKLSLLTSHASVCNTTMVGFDIGYHSRIPLVRIAGTLNSQSYISKGLESVVLPYLQGLDTAIFQLDNARPHVARIVQRFFADRKHVIHGCSTIDPDYTPSCHTRSTSATCGSCLVCCTPKNTSKVSLNQCRGV
ncbi:uncharacterized protein TNCV_4613311 [Trichonephila clavipes]|nr:uncharacterized protein TNCV_4613311 [Trichonephila clavipes]